MSPRHAVTLVAVREIRERLHSKVFLASTLVMLVVVAGSTLLVKALQPENTYRVAVVAPVPPGLQAALQRQF